MRSNFFTANELENKYQLSLPADYREFVESNMRNDYLWNNTSITINDKEEATIINSALEEYNSWNRTCKEQKLLSKTLPIALLAKVEIESVSMELEYLAIDCKSDINPVYVISINIDRDGEGNGHSLSIKIIAASWADFFQQLYFSESTLESLYKKLVKAGTNLQYKKMESLSGSYLSEYAILSADKKSKFAEFLHDVQLIRAQALSELSHNISDPSMQKLMLNDALSCVKHAFDFSIVNHKIYKGNVFSHESNENRNSGVQMLQLLIYTMEEYQQALAILDTFEKELQVDEQTIWHLRCSAAIRGNLTVEAEAVYRKIRNSLAAQKDRIRIEKGNYDEDFKCDEDRKVERIRNDLQNLQTSGNMNLVKHILSWFHIF